MTNTKVMAYLDALHPFNGVGRPDGFRPTGWPVPRRGGVGRQALRAIRAPNLFDAVFYPIFPDPGSNSDTDYPETQRFAQALYPDYLEAADFSDDRVIQTPAPSTRAYFDGITSRNRGTGWIQVNANNTGVGGPYRGYLEETPSSHSTVSAFGLPRINSQDAANAFGWASPQQIHSSWAPAGKAGRTGYSVKFVAFDGLMRTFRVRAPGGGLTRIANPPTGSPNLNTVLH